MIRFRFLKDSDANKTKDWREYIICHYWYFSETNFRFDPKVCNGRHDLMQKAISFLMLQLFL